MNKKKKVPKYGRNKKAFDRVMDAYRKLGAGNINCVRIGGEPGALYKLKTKPSPVEFRADVCKVVKTIVKTEDKLRWFWAAYSFDSLDELDIEIFTFAMLGDRKHSWEQRIGKAFIEANLYPTKKYFAEVVR
jgi:hypothetical protein